MSDRKKKWWPFVVAATVVFIMLFLLFTKFLPVVAISELKEGNDE